MLDAFISSVLIGFLNRIRGLGGVPRWFRILGLYAGFYFVTNDWIAATLVTAPFLLGWPEWEDWLEMSLHGLYITVPVGIYLTIVDYSGIATILLIPSGFMLGTVYWGCRKFTESVNLPNVKGLTHWVELAEINFGMILGGLLCLA